MSEQTAPRPYGRRRRRDDEPGASATSPRGWRLYRGETYYGRPSIKASHWGWLIVSYYFAGGIAGGAQVIATVADLTGAERNRSIVRAARYIALAGTLASPPFLIADLHVPARFYNMLRIVRPTSPMSIGSWVLSAFGLSTSLTALGQGIDDFTGSDTARLAARAAGLPAAASGMAMASYTGALSAATAAPLVAAIPRALPTLFGLAATASALAAISLTLEAIGSTEREHEQIERLSVIIGIAELATHAVIVQTWRKHKIDGPLEGTRLGLVHKVGVIGIGAALPTAIHAAGQLRGRRSRRGTIIAAVATLAGVFAERAVIVFGSNESARRPADYLGFTQPEETSEEVQESGQ